MLWKCLSKLSLWIRWNWFAKQHNFLKILQYVVNFHGFSMKKLSFLQSVAVHVLTRPACGGGPRNSPRRRWKVLIIFFIYLSFSLFRFCGWAVLGLALFPLVSVQGVMTDGWVWMCVCVEGVPRMSPHVVLGLSHLGRTMLTLASFVLSRSE